MAVETNSGIASQDAAEMRDFSVICKKKMGFHCLEIVLQWGILETLAWIFGMRQEHSSSGGSSNRNFPKFQLHTGKSPLSISSSDRRKKNLPCFLPGLEHFLRKSWMPEPEDVSEEASDGTEVDIPAAGGIPVALNVSDIWENSLQKLQWALNPGSNTVSTCLDTSLSFPWIFKSEYPSLLLLLPRLSVFTTFCSLHSLIFHLM